MRVTARNQVTIPASIRRQLGLRPGTEVEFRVEGGALLIAPVRMAGAPGRGLIARLRGRATVRMTTDQIMALTRG